MPISSPPPPLVSVVEQWAPGIYSEFWRLLIGAVRVPVGVTSYWRTPGENRLVGGHPDSQHQLGLGIDLVFLSRSDRDQAASQIKLAGLVAVPETDHLHVQAWPSGIARNSGLLSVLGL